MESFAVNAGKVREVHENGRRWLVADATLIVPGVLPGSQGPLYYPPGQIKRAVNAWDRVPICVGHPTDGTKNISVNSPGVRESRVIGELRNNRWDGAHRAETWFDAEKTRQVDNRVYDALVNAKPIELSTGLYTDSDNSPGVDPISGREYSGTATNYRPDHLAILPDQKGACSNEDGCGINVNSKGILEAFWEWFTGNAGRYGNPQSKNSGRYKPIGAGTGKGEVHEATQRGAMMLTDDDHARGADAKAQDGKPVWVVDDDLWVRATEAADKGNHGDVYWSVVSHIYQRMGGEIQSTTSNEDAMNKEQLIGFITANCDCWKGGEQTLNSLTEDQLVKLKANHERTKALEITANAFAQISQAVGAPTTLTVNEMPAFIKKKIEDKEEAENAKTKNMEDEKEEEEEEEEVPAKNKTKNKKTANARSLTMADVNEAVANALKDNADKRGIVDKLVANVAEADRPARIERLMSKSKTDLQDMLDLLPPVANQTPWTSFFGAGAGSPSPTGNASDDILPLPTLNYAAITKAQREGVA